MAQARRQARPRRHCDQGRHGNVARQEGLEPAQLVQRLVTEHLPETPFLGGSGTVPDRNHFYFTATPEEWEAAMDQLAAGGEALPVLPDEAYDRDNLYEDRL